MLPNSLFIEIKEADVGGKVVFFKGVLGAFITYFNEDWHFFSVQ